MTTNPILVASMTALLSIFNSLGFAWNIPAHMVSGAIAYQILRTESPTTIATVRAVLEKHPGHESRWKEKLDREPDSQRDEMLFMHATRWPDDIRRGQDRAQHRGQWHYISYPFEPDSQPSTVQPKPPDVVNILTALAENERIVKTDSERPASVLG